MIPGKVIDHALPSRMAHAFHELRAIVKCLNRSCECVNIGWWDDDSLNAIFNHIARFPGSNLRQTAGRSFVSHLRAPFALRRENVNCRLAKIFLRRAREADYFHTLVGILLEVGLHLVVERPDEPELRVFQGESMPRL